ncbi:MAG: hypothetical protein U1D67_10955 [Dehalococcoidia bacterium]|nr:hypothetical protein [Dehalococcoidia bacterium]
MIKHIIKKTLTNQKGTTLVEILAGLAISGTLLPLIFTVVLNMFTVTTSSGNLITASQDMEYAAGSIGEDIHRAQATDLIEDAGPVNSLTLSWNEENGGDNVAHYVKYYLSGNQLQQDYDGVVRNVSQFTSNIEFSISNNVIKIKMVSSLEGDSQDSKQLTYLFAI